MIKRLVLALLLGFASLLCVPQAALATTYTPCLRLNLPTPNDPAVANVWGALLNTNFSLLDTASGGTGSISVAGNSNVVLTANSGATDQSRSANFIFTGTLTGNIAVLYPTGGCGSFSVKNSTSGAFTLSIGANNGSGSPAGTVVAVPQGGTIELVSDGTNVRARADLIGLGASLLVAAPANTMLSNWTSGSAASIANTVPVCVDAGGNHLNYVNGTGITCGTSGGATGAEWRVYPNFDQGFVSGGTIEIQMNQKTFDTANICSTVTGRCTPTLAGKYRVSCNMNLSTGSSTPGQIVAQPEILESGAVVTKNSIITEVTSGGFDPVGAQVTDIVSVNGTTDDISCAVFQNSGNNETVLGASNLTSFSGSFVGN